MDSYFFWTSLLAVLAVLSVGATYIVRPYLNGQSPTAFFLRPKIDRRLQVVDHANIDSRRRLVLIRRDDVEHLVMTGGPVDVVIETGIKVAAVQPIVSPAGEVPPMRRTPTFARGPEEPAPLMGAPER